jgi:hypothetical protein
MLPIVEAFKKKYKLKKLVILADAGLLSDKKIKDLCDLKYEFILGGRIKNGVSPKTIGKNRTPILAKPQN